MVKRPEAEIEVLETFEITLEWYSVVISLMKGPAGCDLETTGDEVLLPDLMIVFDKDEVLST